MGRGPADIERTVTLGNPDDIEQADAYLEAGAQHLILNRPHPFDLQPVEKLITISG